VHSQRIGGVVGEHTWTIGDQEETLILTHRAQSRAAFLRGVLPAVRFVAGRERGLYGLGDVLKSLADAAGADGEP
jgi:4-hydroxy-tetrahydrodipicolinate reductase